MFVDFGGDAVKINKQILNIIANNHKVNYQAMTDDELEALVSESLAHINAGEISAGLRKSQLAFELAKIRLAAALGRGSITCPGEGSFSVRALYRNC